MPQSITAQGLKIAAVPGGVLHKGIKNSTWLGRDHVEYPMAKLHDMRDRILRSDTKKRKTHP